MKNQLWQMMITNAKSYLSSANPETGELIDAFEISSVLAICTGKLKEDIILELAGDITSIPRILSFRDVLVGSMAYDSPDKSGNWTYPRGKVTWKGSTIALLKSEYRYLAFNMEEECGVSIEDLDDYNWVIIDSTLYNYNCDPSGIVCYSQSLRHHYYRLEECLRTNFTKIEKLDKHGYWSNSEYKIKSVNDDSIILDLLMDKCNDTGIENFLTDAFENTLLDDELKLSYFIDWDAFTMTIQIRPSED